jgi:large subunit ribosomal protein L11
MAKKIKTTIKLNLPAGAANPAPPVGPALGSHGLNIMEFCKAYNERTADQRGNIIPALITVYDDRTFTFVTKTPPVANMLIKALKVDKGSAVPNKTKIGSVTSDQVRTIAEAKLEDLNTVSIESAMKIIAGTARSMGIDVK